MEGRPRQPEEAAQAQRFEHVWAVGCTVGGEAG